MEHGRLHEAVSRGAQPNGMRGSVFFRLNATRIHLTRADAQESLTINSDVYLLNRDGRIPGGPAHFRRGPESDFCG